MKLRNLFLIIALMVGFITSGTTMDLCRPGYPNCYLYNYTIPGILFFLSLAYILYFIIAYIVKKIRNK